MSTREEMLGRIRKALGRAPEAPSPAPDSQYPELGPVLPPIAPEDLISKFEEELAKVGGQAHRVSTARELEEMLAKLIASAGTGSSEDHPASLGVGIVLSSNPLLAQLGLAERLRRLIGNVAVWPGASLDKTQPASAESLGPGHVVASEQFGAFREQCFEAIVGITGVDFVLAESGSLVLTSATEGSQLASLAPPVHVALYRRRQVVATLEEVLEKAPVAASAQGPSPGRSVVFITGTSRTADIEQILIRGVHGPREVHAILAEESCLA